MILKAHYKLPSGVRSCSSKPMTACEKHTKDSLLVIVPVPSKPINQWLHTKNTLQTPFWCSFLFRVNQWLHTKNTLQTPFWWSFLFRVNQWLHTKSTLQTPFWCSFLFRVNQWLHTKNMKISNWSPEAVHERRIGNTITNERGQKDKQ